MHKQVSLNPKMEGDPDDKVDPRLWLPGFKQADDGSIVHELSDGGDSLHPSYIEDDIGGKGAFEDFTKMFDLDDLVGTGDTGMETIGDIF